MKILDKPNFPLDVIRQEEQLEKRAPGFKRVTDAKICYFCKFNEYLGYKKFQCSKFGIDFGELTVLQVEFTCDEWEKV